MQHRCDAHLLRSDVEVILSPHGRTWSETSSSWTDWLIANSIGRRALLRKHLCEMDVHDVRMLTFCKLYSSRPSNAASAVRGSMPTPHVDSSSDYEAEGLAAGRCQRTFGYIRRLLMFSCYVWRSCRTPPDGNTQYHDYTSDWIRIEIIRYGLS